MRVTQVKGLCSRFGFLYIIASDIKNIAPRDAANIILANNVRLIFSAAHNDLLNFYLTMCNNNNNI